jgi:virginiamycin B lyase
MRLRLQNKRRLALTFVIISFLSLSTIILGRPSGLLTATGNSLISQQPSSNSPITEFPIPYTNPGPNAIVSAPNHIFWFVEYNTGQIGEFNETAKAFNQISIPETGGAIPASLALDGLGRIWFTDQNKNNPSVWVLNASAFPVTFHRYLTNTPNSTPVFVIVDNSTNDAWYTDTTANNIGRIDHLTGQITRFTLPTSNSGPAELALQNGTSYLWVTESFANKVARFDMASHNFQEFTPSVSLVSPVGIAVDKNGIVWVSEHGASSIAELIPSNSTFRKYPTTQPSTYKTTAPATISIDKQGRFWFVEHFGNRVGRLDPTTGIMDEFAIPTSGLAYSLRNALDPSGNFWFTEYTANQLGMIPWNATSPIAASSILAPLTVNAGQTVASQISLSDTTTSSVTVNLNVTSTFTTYGQTSATEVALSNYSLVLNPNQAKTVTLSITPDGNLPSGLYTAGIVATDGKSSSVGVVFLQVHGTFSILNLLQTYLPAIAIAAASILVLTSILIRRGRARSAPLDSNPKVPLGTIIIIGTILIVLAVQAIPPSTAKCIGLPPPPPNGQPAGPDYIGLGLDIGSLAFFVVVLYLILKSRHKNKPSSPGKPP